MNSWTSAQSTGWAVPGAGPTTSTSAESSFAARPVWLMEGRPALLLGASSSSSIGWNQGPRAARSTPKMLPSNRPSTTSIRNWPAGLREHRVRKGVPVGAQCSHVFQLVGVEAEELFVRLVVVAWAVDTRQPLEDAVRKRVDEALVVLR